MRMLRGKRGLGRLAGVLIACQAVLILGADEQQQQSSSENLLDAIQVPNVAATRARRFPSVEQRLKVYLSNWYVPPCPNYKKGLLHYGYNRSQEYPILTVKEASDRGVNATTLELQSVVEPDMVFYLDRETILECNMLRHLESGGNESSTPSRVLAPRNMFMYCQDTLISLLRAVDHVGWELELNDDQLPILLQYGDLPHSHIYGHLNVPHFKKFRPATTSKDLEHVTSKECYNRARDALATVHDTHNLQAIIWKLASRRHFGLLDKVAHEDTPWTLKLGMAIFRGQLTGSRDGFDKEKTPEENCHNLRRCRLVYDHANSTRVHARLTSTRNRLPNILNGVNLMAPAITIKKLLQYKAIIMLEGNDVASGLKWALLSQSVVLMPPPKHTSWAMEELLEPWVHYIPLNENATDVEEKMQWVIDNDEIAQRISERGTLWMEDLVFHPDAAEDDRLIQEEMMRRYRAHFSDHQLDL